MAQQGNPCHTQEHQPYLADRDSGFEDREQRPEPRAHGRGRRDWRQPVVEGAGGSGGSYQPYECCPGGPDGDEARRRGPQGHGRPRYHPEFGGHGRHALVGPVFCIGPGRRPRMDGPAISPWPWAGEKPRRREGLVYGAARRSERQEDTGDLIRLPRIPERDHLERMADSEGGSGAGGSYRSGHGGRGGGSSINAGGGRDRLEPGARGVERRDFGEEPKV